MRFLSAKTNTPSDYLSQKPKWGILDHEKYDNFLEVVVQVKKVVTRNMAETPLSIDIYKALISDRDYLEVV